MGGTLREDDKEETVLGRISSFRTVSYDVVLVLAKTVPIDVLADEMRTIYFLECPEQIATITPEERKCPIHKRQSRWEKSLRGIWRFHFVPFIIPSMENKHCELNYYMTQSLIGHECFRMYLHRFFLDAQTA